jgi:hypothetical protein
MKKCWNINISTILWVALNFQKDIEIPWSTSPCLKQHLLLTTPISDERFRRYELGRTNWILLNILWVTLNFPKWSWDALVHNPLSQGTCYEQHQFLMRGLGYMSSDGRADTTATVCSNECFFREHKHLEYVICESDFSFKTFIFNFSIVNFIFCVVIYQFQLCKVCMYPS